MKRKTLIGLIGGLFFLLSCSDDIDPEFTMETDVNGIVLASAEGSSAVIRFTSARNWRAGADSDWLRCSPSSGQAGTFDLTVTAASGNEGTEARTAVVTLSSGSLTKKITIQQEEGDYVLPEQSSYNIPAAGDSLAIVFTTNVAEDELAIYGSGEYWVTQQRTQGRSASTYAVNLYILANVGSASRSSYVYFYKESGRERTLLSTVTIVQDGTRSGESADYSADKTVTVMQKAGKGSGLPIVVMGDGFIDTDIADGTYDEVMAKAVDNLFSEEPMTSLRDYFDIYSVAAVSKNNTFGTGYETAFSCELAGGTSTFIGGDDEAVMDYVEAISGIRLEDVLAVVVLNTTSYAGTTYFGYSDEKGNALEFAISYCPTVYELESEGFREVLVHEAVGHGFAKLEDEYGYSYNGTIPASEVEQLQYMQKLGWAQNVDFTTDTEKVLWAAFLGDSRYDSEGLGIFEGACTYVKGVYRPTEDSMMNTNTCGFNAPSRKAIYEMVMKRGLGTMVSYEDFVAFDATLQKQTAARQAAASPGEPFARPQWTGKALKRR